MKAEIRSLRLRTGITVPCLVQSGADANPVLLLHPWGESRGCFDRIIPGLVGFRVYAPDLRGQGGADKPEDGYSLAEQAEDAAAILDALHVSEASVVGSSSGGYVAQQLPLCRRSGQAPTLILWGAQDNLLPRSGQETLAARTSGAVLKAYPGVAHAVLWECPDQVAEDTTAFLTSLG